MTIQRVKVCAVCATEFTTSQIKAKYCPDCRGKAKHQNQKDRRQKIAEKRVVKLPASEEWLWVAREVRRAGTVECLHSHTVETLEQLFELRNYKYKTYDFDFEKKRSKFHLCHIQPVKGSSSVGLLHPHNLFIGPSLANQVHRTKCYESAGLSISRFSLQSRWLIPEDMPDPKVLEKVQKYLGQVLIDYAKVNPIRTSQRLSLARWIHKNVPNCAHTLERLERMGMTELRKIRAEFEEKEIYQMDLRTKRSIVVALDEAVRLSEQLPQGQHRNDVAFLIPVLTVAGAWLSRQEDQEGLASILDRPYGVCWNPVALREGVDASAFRDFIAFQTFQTMQGAPLDRGMVLNTLRKYLHVPTLTPDYSNSNSSMQSVFRDQYVNFYSQVPTIQKAILAVGICNSVQEYEYLEKVREADREMAIFESFGYETCKDEFDYSTVNIQIEEDYVPNPSNPRLRKFIEPIFIDF
ncbi:hypothetical protein [Pseudomonas putida]|uniref:hypothetical protein n=1 Tax=Pseudomonas TaxID=286 RepID=UPI002B24223A|nr:hypothetical protein [Pseudomonas putida]